MIALFWLIFPGAMVLVASAAGVCYVLASAAAVADRIAGIWIAFVFTILTAAFSLWGVYRYLDNGFDYLAGNFPGRAGFYWPAYLFALVALGAVVVIVLHLASWRWMIRPRQQRPRQA